ncbi:MAG: helix-turn-helix transcriptional regulator [Actinomycetales bacterium]|nr:helix-turn-helix transcriptional regulator [Actinomycetales bacterium]
MPLRDARRRLGLTQARVAELLGTSQANVSAYERGRLIPGRTVGPRITAFEALPDDTVYRKLWPMTLAGAALQLREDLNAGRSQGDMLRVIIQASDDFAKLPSPRERALFLASPGSTGDRRYDALLGGLGVHLSRVAGMQTTPAWTREPGRFLEAIWWFDSEAPTLRALTLRDCLPAMRARGVMFSRQNLDSV